MGTFVLTNATLSVGGVDLSDHVESLTINYEAESVDDTVMSDSTRSVTGGLKNWSFDVVFKQDFASSKVDITLFAAVGTTVTLVAKPTSAGVSSTNPTFTGTGLIQSYPPISGTVGDHATTNVTFASAGDLVRAET